MHLRFLSMIAGLGLMSCTEDFDQYSFGGAGASGAGASGAGASGGGGSSSGGAPSGGSSSGGSASGGSASGGSPQGGGPSSGGAGGGNTGGSGGSGGGVTFSLPCGGSNDANLVCTGPDQQCCDKDNGMVSCGDSGSGCSGNNIEIRCRVSPDCGDDDCCADLSGDTGTVTCVEDCMDLLMCEDNADCTDPMTCKPVATMPIGYFACLP